MTMREIKFRGYSPILNKWVYGFLVKGDENVYIVYGAYEDDYRYAFENVFIEVDPKSIAEFTGLKDKNGVDVYEGDLLREPALSDWDKVNYNSHEVFFHDNDSCSYHIGWQMDRMHCHGAVCGGYTPAFKPANVSKLIVIGNICQNPELLIKTA